MCSLALTGCNCERTNQCRVGKACAMPPKSQFEWMFPNCLPVKAMNQSTSAHFCRSLRQIANVSNPPFAFDQMDNALRVKKLGAGDWLKPRNRSTEALAAPLKEVIGPEPSVQAKIIATRFEGRSGLECAADSIDE